MLYIYYTLPSILMVLHFLPVLKGEKEDVFLCSALFWKLQWNILMAQNMDESGNIWVLCKFSHMQYNSLYFSHPHTFLDD